MGKKNNISREARQIIKEYAERLPAYHAFYEEGKRKDQLIWLLAKKSGYKLIQQGVYKDSDGKDILQKHHYWVESEPVMKEPYDFLVNYISKQPEFSNEVFNEAVNAFWEEFKHSQELVKKHNANAKAKNL